MCVHLEMRVLLQSDREREVSSRDARSVVPDPPSDFLPPKKATGDKSSDLVTEIDVIK